MEPLIIFLLFVHVISAVFLVGSSIFVWIVVWPVSSLSFENERMRTRFMSLMGKKYAFFTNLSILLLTVTGLLLIYIIRPLYFTDFSQAMGTSWGPTLTIKVVTVGVMYGILYGNNLWHGKKFPLLAEEGKFDLLKQMRKIAHVLSFITVGLMVLIVLEAEILAGVFF